MELESLANAPQVCEALELELKRKGLKIPTIKEAANQALREHAARKEELEQLRAELNSLEPGIDPATPESLSRIGQYVRDMQADMEAIPAEQRKTQNYKIAEHCHEMLKEEWRAQYRKLAADKMRTEFLQYVIGLRELLIEGQAATDEIADLRDAQIARSLFKFYSDTLTPALTKCLVTPIVEILKGGIV
jgi:hypothetical protein